MNKLIVHHRTDGHGNYEKCPDQERTVAHWYEWGVKCQDDVGDVWFVRLGNDGKYHTVA